MCVCGCDGRGMGGKAIEAVKVGGEVHRGQQCLIRLFCWCWLSDLKLYLHMFSLIELLSPVNNISLAQRKKITTKVSALILCCLMTSFVSQSLA